MPRNTSSDPDYNGGGPGLGGMTPPSHWSGHSPPSGGQTSPQQAAAGHIAAVSRRSRQAGGGVLPLGSRTERLGRVNDALVARNAARAKRAAGDTPETGSKTQDDLASASSATTSPSGRARIKAGLRGKRAEDLGMRWGALTASSAQRRGFRRVDDLEARYGRAGQRDWGARTRAMAQELLDREGSIPSGRRAAVQAKIRRENKIANALRRRDYAVGRQRLGEPSPTTGSKTRDELASLGRKDAMPISQWPFDRIRAAKQNLRVLRAQKVGAAAAARRRAAGKPIDGMDRNRLVRWVNALEAQYASGTTPWGSETRRMARQKLSDESNEARLAQIAAARRQGITTPAQPAQRAPVARGRRGGSDPDSQFGNDRLGGGRPGRASALTSRVRGPEPRSDGKRHAEESLRLPEGHEFQDIDEIPPKGFPAHLDEVTPSGGGERLPIDLSGVTFKQWHHEGRSGDDPEHMANFHAMTPGVRKTAAGKLFVQKIALPGKRGSEAVDSSRKSTNQEMIADRIFRILGVPAPRSQVYSLKTGLPVPHDYQWAPGEASTRLAEHLGKDSTTVGSAHRRHQSEWEGHERRYAVAKALLDHGDDHMGNTMLDGKHMDVPWKVDNGSALKYNAFGGEKSSSTWGEVSPQSVLFPQLYQMIGDGIVTPREAYRQMEGIAKIWRRHGGAIRELYKNDDDPKQAKIFASRAESIVRAVHMFKGPKEFARAMRTHLRAYDRGGRATTSDLMPKRRARSSGSEFMARSFRWGMNV